MAEAEINVIPNPLINIMLQGRHDTFPKRRGLTRVRELMDAGLNVSLGQDCTMDPWYSMGSADMLEVAHMGIHVAQMGGIEDKKQIYDAITLNSAKTMGLENYGLEVGCNADLVILQANDVIEALRLKPTRLYVIKSGKVISQTPARISELSLDGRPSVIDMGKDYVPMKHDQ